MPTWRMTFLVAATLAASLATAPARADEATRPGMAQFSVNLSAQARRPVRRARITVRPPRGIGPLRRECVPVFEERLIPQWGGRVLYASQRCWWTRAPLAPGEVY
jgi:hypothetical protein